MSIAEAPEEAAAVESRSAPKRRRLLPRFRLRTLFAAGVLMSLALGWYGRYVYRVRQERAAAEALRQVGAKLTMPTFEYAGMTLPADLYGWFPWFYVEQHTSVSLDSADGATDLDTQHLPACGAFRPFGSSEKVSRTKRYEARRALDRWTIWSLKERRLLAKASPNLPTTNDFESCTSDRAPFRDRACSKASMR